MRWSALVRVAGATAAVLALATVAVGLDARPAHAHGAGGVGASNFETRVLSVRPGVPGVGIRSVDLGESLELTNTTDTAVVVLGYDDEPYLRVGPGGAFENVRSPAVYLNRDRRAFGKVPAKADADAEPEWRRTGDGPSVRWHDHRAHWMGNEDPPAVQRDRGREQLVQPFTLRLVAGDETITVRGDVRWVPGPSPWPWVALALVLAGATFLFGRSRLGVALAAALVLLLGAQVVHVVGLWGATSASFGSRLGASAYSLAGMALALFALGVVWRSGTYSGAPLALLAGLFLLLSGGLADITVLGRSQVATTLPTWVDRLTVAVTIGTGIALVALGIRRLWRPDGVRPVPGAGTSEPATVVPAGMEARYRAPDAPTSR